MPSAMHHTNPLGQTLHFARLAVTCSPLRPHDLCTVAAQAAQAAEQAAQRAAQDADERGASVAEQERRIAAVQSELSAAQQRLLQQQAELEVTGAAVTMTLLHRKRHLLALSPAARQDCLSNSPNKHHTTIVRCLVESCTAGTQRRGGEIGAGG